jgi:uncharacterized protein (DUF2062 family)
MEQTPNRPTFPPRTPRGRLRSALRRAWTRIYRLLREKDPPHRIALGLALGIFIGMLPIMGIQMAVVAICALPFRANIKAGVVGVWISNPITVIPLYYANYRFGLLFHPARGTDQAAFSTALEAASEWDWGDIGGSLGRMFDFGAEILEPLWLGSAILGVLLGVPTYFVTRRVVTKGRERLERRRAEREARRAAS